MSADQTLNFLKMPNFIPHFLKLQIFQKSQYQKAELTTRCSSLYPYTMVSLAPKLLECYCCSKAQVRSHIGPYFFIFFLKLHWSLINIFSTKKKKKKLNCEWYMIKWRGPPDPIKVQVVKKINSFSNIFHSRQITLSLSETLSPSGFELWTLKNSPMASSQKLTEYERKRLDNIRSNDEMMAALKVHSKATELSTASSKRQRSLFLSL